METNKRAQEEEMWRNREVENMESHVEMEPMRFDGSEAASIALRALRGDKGALWNLQALNNGLCKTRREAKVLITGLEDIHDLSKHHQLNGTYLVARLLLPDGKGGINDLPLSYQMIDGYNTASIMDELDGLGKAIKESDGGDVEIAPGLIVSPDANTQLLDWLEL